MRIMWVKHLASDSFRGGTLGFFPPPPPPNKKKTWKISIALENFHRGRVPFGWFGSGSVIQDHWRVMGYQRSPWIGVQSGFIDSFDAPWSEWSWITDPDPITQRNLADSEFHRQSETLRMLSIDEFSSKKKDIMITALSYSTLSCFKMCLWNLSQHFRNLEMRRNTSTHDTFSGADPGFFLGGGAPLRNGVTDWWPDENTSCIRKPQVISAEGGGWGVHPYPAPSP